MLPPPNLSSSVGSASALCACDDHQRLCAVLHVALPPMKAGHACCIVLYARNGFALDRKVFKLQLGEFESCGMCRLVVGCQCSAHGVCTVLQSAVTGGDVTKLRLPTNSATLPRIHKRCPLHGHPQRPA